MNIKAEAEGASIKKINLKTREGTDDDALCFNPSTLKKKGLPEGCEFAVKFETETPAVISKKNKNATYYYVYEV